MELSKRVDLGFRALVYLALLEDDKQATIQEIAQAYNEPKSHLMKIVSALVNAGIVDATRGKYGGIRLKVCASDIRLNSVIEALEPSMLTINCSERNCIIEDACGLPRILNKARQAYMSELEAYNLSDIVMPSTAQVFLN